MQKVPCFYNKFKGHQTLMYMNYIVTILDKKLAVEYFSSLVACGFNTDIEVDKPLRRGRATVTPNNPYTRPYIIMIQQSI